MSDNGSTPPPPPPGRNPRLPSKADGGWPRWAAWLVLGVVITLIIATSTLSSSTSKEVSYTEFLQMVADDEVEQAIFDNVDAGIEFTNSDGETFQTTGFAEVPAAHLELMAENGVDVKPETPTPNIFWSLAPIMLPMLMIIGVFVFIARRQQSQMGGIMSIGRSKAKTYTTERPGTSFGDVAGYAAVKKEVTEVVDFLRDPSQFSDVGARIPKGVLLVGPPGTGKTLIARAVAGEAGVPFMSVTGSDFMEMFVGVGASRVRDLFQEARKMGKAIIFIDEIDSIGRKRGAGHGGGHDEREQTLNQMLAEMDGFEATEGIVMMAATNRPDILDPALLRPGRFDRQVVVPLPELDDRREILKVHLKHKKMADDVDINVIARGTPGMSGADLANLVNEAALFAVRTGAKIVNAAHFDAARDRILMGVKRDSMVLNEAEREAVAYHEAGHALCAAVLPHADPLHKVTIIPSGMALGVTMQLPEEERHIYRRDYIEDRLVVMLGGRMAEKIIFNMTSTGAADDLMKATDTASKMVKEWGMSDRVGPMAWGAGQQVFLGDSFGEAKNYSEETAKVIDEETQRILLEAEDRCFRTLTENRHALDLVARNLLEKETVSGAEVDRLIEATRNPEPVVPSASPAVSNAGVGKPAEE